MNINFKDLGNNLWETAQGGLYLAAGVLITHELVHAGSAVGFSAKVLNNRAMSNIVLFIMAFQIHSIVEVIFERLDWNPDHMGLFLANMAISIIATAGLALAGSRGNQVAAYTMTSISVCATAMLILLGINQISSGLQRSYEAITT